PAPAHAAEHLQSEEHGQEHAQCDQWDVLRDVGRTGGREEKDPERVREKRGAAEHDQSRPPHDEGPVVDPELVHRQPVAVDETARCDPYDTPASGDGEADVRAEIEERTALVDLPAVHQESAAPVEDAVLELDL